MTHLIDDLMKWTSTCYKRTSPLRIFSICLNMGNSSSRLSDSDVAHRRLTRRKALKKNNDTTYTDTYDDLVINFVFYNNYNNDKL